MGTLDRIRLAKLLGMLGSSHDGEVVNAGRAADRLVREAGLRWPDVTQPTLPPAPYGADIVDDPIGFCLEQSEQLTDWEWQFLHSLQRQSYPPTRKQATVVARIVGKVAAAGGRG
jgi:hypothetical protein